MVDFEATLKQALDGINDDFKKAQTDLNEVVAAAARAVEKLTSGRVKLDLLTLLHKPNETTYALRLSGDAMPAGVNKYVGGFGISHTGYPISFLDVDSQNLDRYGPTAEGLYWRGRIEILDRNTLENHVGDMLSDPDAPLLVNIAYILRSQPAPAGA